MKKIDIVQTTILVIAILNADSVVGHLLSLLANIPLYSLPYFGGFGETITQSIIIIVLAVAVYLLIRYSRRIAAWLLKSDPEGDEEGAARWDVDRRTLVFALIVGIGLYSFFFGLAYAIDDFCNLFKDKVAVGNGTTIDPAKTHDMVLQLLKVTIGGLLVYAAPTLTNFIEKKIAVRLKSPKTEDPTDSSDMQTDTTESLTDTQSS